MLVFDGESWCLMTFGGNDAIARMLMIRRRHGGAVQYLAWLTHWNFSVCGESKLRVNVNHSWDRH